METLAVVGVNIALALLQLLDLRWVIDQATCGNITPLSMWTIFVAFTGFTVGYIVGKKRAGYVPKRKIAKGFTANIKKAAADALKADGVIPLNGLCEDVASFNALHPGIFALGDKPEEMGSGTAYQLSPEWRRYLHRHRRYLE